MKKFLVLVIGLLMSGSAWAKIGFVDMQKAIQATKEGIKAKKELQAEADKKKEQFKKKNEDINKMREDLDKKSLVLSEDVKNQKRRELEQKMGDFQMEVQKTQQELMEKESKALQPILEKMKKVIGDLAKKEDYDAVLLKREDNVVWAKEGTDITDKILKAYSK